MVAIVIFVSTIGVTDLAALAAAGRSGRRSAMTLGPTLDCVARRPGRRRGSGGLQSPGVRFLSSKNFLQINKLSCG
jgi:hypothetical protein